MKTPSDFSVSVISEHRIWTLSLQSSKAQHLAVVLYGF